MTFVSSGTKSKPLLPNDKHKLDDLSKHPGGSNVVIDHYMHSSPNFNELAINSRNNSILSYNNQDANEGGNESTGRALTDSKLFIALNNNSYSSSSYSDQYTLESDSSDSPITNTNNNDINDDTYSSKKVQKKKVIVKKDHNNIESNNNEDWAQKGAAKFIKQFTDPKTGKIKRELVSRGINDFKFGEVIGDGSYSTVSLVTAKDTKKQYAVKTLNKQYLIKQKKVKYVNIEKEALQKLNNSIGIIKLYCTFQDESSLYFLLEFAPNGDLLSLMKKYGSLNEETTCHFSAQIIDAIHFIHFNGIIHRDIKPENILLDKDLKIKLTDFGTAKILKSNNNNNTSTTNNNNFDLLTRSKSFVGTAEYVSPELLIDSYTDSRCDIWAFGCILFQMIAGKPPFKATNEYLTFQKVIKVQFAFTAGFPTIVRDLIKKILVKNPNKRLTIPEIKSHLFYSDKDFSNKFDIYDSNLPDIKPYKMTALSMKPLPKSNLTYQSSPNNIKFIIPCFLQSQYNNNNNNNISINNNNLSMPSTPNQYNNNNNLNDPKKSKSTNSLSSMNNNNNTNNRKNISPLIKNSPKFDENNNNDNNTKRLSNNLHNIPSKINTHSSSGSNSNYSPSTVVSNSPSIPHNNKSSQIEITSPLLDHHKIINSSSSSSSAVLPNNFSSPQLSTSSNLSNHNNIHSSSTTSINNIIPPLNATDLAWLDFMKHPDERIIKVGEVDFAQIETSILDKKVDKYDGNVIDPQIFGAPRNTKLSQMVKNGGQVSGLRNDSKKDSLPNKSYFYKEYNFHIDQTNKNYLIPNGDIFSDSLINPNSNSNNNSTNFNPIESESNNNSSSSSNNNNSTAGFGDKFKKFWNKSDLFNDQTTNQNINTYTRTFIMTNFARLLILTKKAPKYYLGTSNDDKINNAFIYEVMFEINLSADGIMVKELVLPSMISSPFITGLITTPYESFFFRSSSPVVHNWFKAMRKGIRLNSSYKLSKGKLDNQHLKQAMKAAKFAASRNTSLGEAFNESPKGTRFSPNPSPRGSHLSPSPTLGSKSAGESKSKTTTPNLSTHHLKNRTTPKDPSTQSPKLSKSTNTLGLGLSHKPNKKSVLKKALSPGYRNGQDD